MIQRVRVDHEGGELLRLQKIVIVKAPIFVLSQALGAHWMPGMHMPPPMLPHPSMPMLPHAMPGPSQFSFQTNKAPSVALS